MPTYIQEGSTGAQIAAIINGVIDALEAIDPQVLADALAEAQTIAGQAATTAGAAATAAAAAQEAADDALAAAAAIDLTPYAPLAGAAFSGPVSAPTLELANGTRVGVGAVPAGTTPALSIAGGEVKTWTLTGNSTPTDGLSSGEGLLLLINDGLAYTITWPAGIIWNYGSPPTLATSGFTVISLMKIGSQLYGDFRGELSA